MKLRNPGGLGVTGALNLLMPQTCWLTGIPVSQNDVAVSSPIRDQLAVQIQLPYCHRCGANRTPGAGHCPLCPHRHLGTAEIIRTGGYTHPLKELIAKFKFGRHWALAPLLASQMTEAWERAGQPRVDVLVPIPLHWWREFSRGFNQSRELARFLSRSMGTPFVDGLVRRKRTPRQSLAGSANQRRENLRGAIAAKPLDWSGQHVWLVDDVCTTGSTLHAAAMAFAALPAEYQPERISALVLAVTGMERSSGTS
ncbi:MAG: ComF family protein [Phycisphaerae bacterium]